ncbi:MAG: hypothetical protein ACI4EO_07645 [Blautia sp.]
MQLFYYGTWLTGLLSLVSILAIYGSNRSVLGDLKRIPSVKNKWLKNYLQEYQNHLKNSTVIHNPAVYMTRRMRGRKIGKIPVRRIKGFSWLTFVLSFLCMGIGLWEIQRTGMEMIRIPPVRQNLPALAFLAVTGTGMGILNLLLRIFLSPGYQEDMIETTILDYMENRSRGNPKEEEKDRKVSTKQNVREFPARQAAARKMSRRARVREKAKEQQIQEYQVSGKNEDRVGNNRNQEQQIKAVETRIRETAATDERYRHFLDEEEEKIVKDVIQEFLK